MSENIHQTINQFIKKYTDMDIEGVMVHCPYWMNKLKDGRVILRGFANGKGKPDEIREELVKRLNKLSVEMKFELTPESLRKFARRERIGIDCSGFVYRTLDHLLFLGYGNTGYKSLDKIFNGGINKTNVKRLTNPQYSEEIRNIKELKLGDIIRIMGGKHALVVVRLNAETIDYAHSSFLRTKIQGVHTSIIQIIEVNGSLRDQQWMEETRTGDNFGEKYFHPEKGDGVFRLKIFN